MTNDIKDAVAKEVARQLAEQKAKEEPKPFKPQPYQRYDPTAGMCMPPSTMQGMIAAEPKGFMKGVVGDNRAPTTPGTIPRSEQPSNVRSGKVPGDGKGFAQEISRGPSARSIDLIDRGVNAALPHGPEWGKEKKE